MGASQSSNVASAVADVTNYVNQSTTANAQQQASINQKIQIQDCTLNIAGNFDTKTTANLVQKNTQIAQAIQKADVKNDIQQKMLQAASSTVGAMGIGYADASNSASMFVNASSTIINSMDESVNQFANINQSFICDRSTINAKNLNIDFSTEDSFLSDQTLNNSQTATIVNNISQTADQKATASIEGMTGLLIAIAIIIAAVGYAVAKPLSSGSFKIIIGAIVIFVLAIILSFMYIKKTPPFFNNDNECVPNSSLGGCSVDCIDLTTGSKVLSTSPLRYIYGIIPGDECLSGANLLQIAISTVGQGNAPIVNGGYNMDTYNSFVNKLARYNDLAKKLGVQMIPNPLQILQPPPAPNYYYLVPPEYRADGEGPNGAKCTPGSLSEAEVGSAGDFSKCPSSGFVSTSYSSTKPSDSHILASFNLDAWKSYLQSNDPKYAKFARFVLCDIIGNIPMNIYIEDDELVSCQDETGNNLPTDFAKNLQKYSYKFQTDGNYDFRRGLGNGGKLTGLYGVCNDNTYKFHSFMRKIGSWILLSMLLCAFIYMGYTWYKNRGNSQGEGSEGTAEEKK